MRKRARGSVASRYNLRKLLILPVILAIAAFGIVYFSSDQYSADELTSNAQVVCSTSQLQKLKNSVLGISPVCNSKLKIEVEQPFQSSPVAFPNGKDCINVTLEAYKKDGTFLTNEPLVIVKPDAVTVSGPQTTDTGVVKWCVTSTAQIKARIIVKLKNLPKIQSTISANFNPKLKITDESDRNSFLYGKPLTFTAQIDPAIISSLKESNVIVVYQRRFNKWGRWRTRGQQVVVKLQCTEIGRCTGTLTGDHTTTVRNPKGTFKYTFIFSDTKGNKFQTTFNGHLTGL